MPRGSNFKRPYPPELRREAFALYRSGSLAECGRRDLGISTESPHEGRILFRRDELDAWLAGFAQGGPR